MAKVPLQVGNVARKKTRRFQIPLWLLLLFVPFATFALVILFKGEQSRSSHAADLAALQGDWRLVRVGMNGVTTEAKSGSWKISGNRLRSRLRTIGDEQYDTFNIYPEKSPKEIVFRTDFFGHGIYALEGDRLLLCLARHKNPTPQSFAAGDKNTLLEFQRVRK